MQTGINWDSAGLTIIGFQIALHQILTYLK